MADLDFFLKNALIPMYAITLGLALFKYPKYFESKLKYLPIIFIYTLLNEFLGYLINNYEEFSLISAKTYQNYNWLIYNIYMVVFYLYFFYVFRFYIEDSKQKQNIQYGAIFFLFICLINAFIDSFSKLPQVYSYIMGGIILVYCCFSYLNKFYKINKIFIAKENLLFWLSIGLSVFYIGYLPLKIIRHIHLINDTTPSILIKRIHFTLIVVNYLCFIIGFLRMKRRLPK